MAFRRRLIRRAAGVCLVALVAGACSSGTPGRNELKGSSDLQGPNIGDKVGASMPADTPSTATVNTAKFVWGAGGDSFASGEGNPEVPIARGEKTKGDDPNDFSGLRWGDDTSISTDVNGNPLSAGALADEVMTCHRSDEAGAPKANRKLQQLYTGVQFVLGFVACSGAEVKHMTNTTYTGPKKVEASRQGRPEVVQPPQLDRMRGLKAKHNKLDAFYMSIGGNNMGFGDLIKDCIITGAPGNCVDKWEPELQKRSGDLLSSYDNILRISLNDKLPGVPVLISDYPNPMSRSGGGACQGPDYDAHGEVGAGGFDDILQDNISVGEAAFALGVPDRINRVIAQELQNQARNQNANWRQVTAHAVTGRGVCTDAPMFNLNSRALRTQGQDVPDTAFLRFSSGFMHPNNAGFEAYGDAIVGNLRSLVDNVVRAGFVAPTDVRVAAAVRDGAVTLRWRDMSTSENAYQAEITDPSGAKSIKQVNGVNGQEFVHQTTVKGQFGYRVRACHSALASGTGQNDDFRCGPWSASIGGSNQFPASPSNVRAATGAAKTTNVGWDAAPGAIDYVVRTRNADGSDTALKRTTALTLNVAGVAPTKTFEVAACNRTGCSFYVKAAT